MQLPGYARRTAEGGCPHMEIPLHGVGPFRLYISDADDQAFAKCRRCPRDCIECYRNITGVEQTVQLRPARAQLFCHRLLGLLLFAPNTLHSMGNV